MSGKKAGLFLRIRRRLARMACRLMGVEMAPPPKAPQHDWKSAAEAFVVEMIPLLLDAHAGDAEALTLPVDGRGFYCYKYQTVRKALPMMEFIDEPQSGDRCFFWGFGKSWNNVRAAELCLRRGCIPVLCEDGFLRSADTWATTKYGPRYCHGCSVIFDSRGFYYDAMRTSTVELMLNDPNLVVTGEQRREARRLIDRIVSEKLTKYNHQPIFTPQVGRPGRRKVLVVDQSYGDFAIRRGWGSDKTFADMLEDAKRENPDADILVKTHPDTMTGKKAGYYDDVHEEEGVFRVTMPINPYSLMEVVDKVYVCSTQLGFEALMVGKEVHVYGMPFYAGWGLTHDAQRKELRVNRRSLEEVFYIFYVLYTHWIDIETGAPCSIDRAIDNLLVLRAEYRAILARAAEEGKA